MARYTFPGVFSDEQAELRGVVRAFLERYSTEADVRRLMATEDGYDRPLWRRAAVELGLQGMAVPEEYGGGGFGYQELGIVFEEMGRALFGAPYFATVALATEALLRSGDTAAAKDLLPGIAAGATVATLALTEQDGRWDTLGGTARARLAGGGWTVTGAKTFVPDGLAADLLLVGARTEAGPSLFAIEATAPGVRRTALPTMDQTRKQARLDLHEAPARLIGVDGGARSVLAQTLATAGILLAAEQVGGASKALELAVDHAKLRVQYGHPIGAFQGIKHLCADLLAEIEAARSAVYDGLWSLAAGSADLPIAAELAQVCGSEVYPRAALDCVQVHGGIGFTWEHPAHLHVKRATSSAVLLGPPADHRERVAALLDL